MSSDKMAFIEHNNYAHNDDAPPIHTAVYTPLEDFHCSGLLRLLAILGHHNLSPSPLYIGALISPLECMNA